MAKKIVLISLATYPYQSPRSMRTDELAKEFVRQGHTVILYVLIGDYDYTTYEQETGIQIKPLGEPYLFNFNHKKGVSFNLFMKIINKLIGKFLELPFIELLFNTYSVLKYEKDVDMLITVAVPYPLHWGAALYATKYPSKFKNTIWIADCGDPYMGNDFHKKPFYFKYIEKWFCSKAHFISVPLEKAQFGYFPEFYNKIRIIPQGFNFEETRIIKNYVKNSVPTFIYAGIFYEKLRDPRPLLDYLISLDIDFKFIVYTKNPDFLKDYKSKLAGKLEVYNYIPRNELIFKMSQADFLLNLENPSTVHSPSKLIDYALSQRPILSINTNLEIDIALINDFMNGNYEKSLHIGDVEQYNIKNVAKKFLDLSFS